MGTGRKDYDNKGDYFFGNIKNCFSIEYAKNNNLVSEEMIVHERHLEYRKNESSTLQPELRNQIDNDRDHRKIILFDSVTSIFNQKYSNIEFNQNPILYLDP